MLAGSACGAGMGFHSRFHTDATEARGKIHHQHHLEGRHVLDGPKMIIDAKSNFRNLGSQKYSL